MSLTQRYLEAMAAWGRRRERMCPKHVHVFCLSIILLASVFEPAHNQECKYLCAHVCDMERNETGPAESQSC